MNVALARKKLAARSGGICEICGCRRATNAQHRKNRSQGGTWDLSNLLHVCGSGTTGCHGAIHARPTCAYTRGWAVEQPYVPAEVPVLVRSEFDQGLVWLTDDGEREPVDSASPRRRMLAPPTPKRAA